MSLIKGMGPPRAGAEGAGALTACSRPALQPGAKETGKREGFSVIFPQRKGGKWLGDAGRGAGRRSRQRGPCPAGLPVPPSPRAPITLCPARRQAPRWSLSPPHRTASSQPKQGKLPPAPCLPPGLNSCQQPTAGVCQASPDTRHARRDGGND